jgi:hypothetical protein
VPVLGYAVSAGQKCPDGLCEFLWVVDVSEVAAWEEVTSMPRRAASWPAGLAEPRVAFITHKEVHRRGYFGDSVGVRQDRPATPMNRAAQITWVGIIQDTTIRLERGSSEASWSKAPQVAR